MVRILGKTASRFARAIENCKIPVVPNIVLGGSGKSGSDSLVEAMLVPR